MVSIKWESDSTVDSVMTTELNSLADDANAISSAIDNSTNLFIFDDIELYTAALGYTPTAGSSLDLYIIDALDSTNYEDGDSTIDPPANCYVGSFQMRASTAAQRHTIRQVYIPPGKFKYLVINKSGGALPSSGNTLRRKSFRLQSN